MHPLTKVFVVLMTVLSIVLVSMVVPFVANTENYRDQREAAMSRAAAAEANAAVAQASSDASRSELNAQIDEIQKLLTAQRTLNDSLKGELATERGNLERTRADLVRTQADIANLTAANAQFAKIQDDHQKELAMRREENLKQARQIIEIETSNNDQSSSVATLRRQLRLAQENLIKTQEELSEATSALVKIPVEVRNQYLSAGVSADTDNSFNADVVTVGQVSDVKQAGETTLVQLNIGRNGGVKERMRFVVSRDGQYLGTIVVMTVDEQAAVARVKTLKSGSTLKSGDSARSGPIN